jgi:hypothetical protein
MKLNKQFFKILIVITLTMAFAFGSLLPPVSAVDTKPVVTLADGKLAAPALAFASSPATGWYYGGSHSAKFASNGVLKFTIGSAVTSNGNFTAAGTFTSTGAATFSSTLAVTGATTQTGLLTANGGITLGSGKAVTFDSSSTSASSGAATLDVQCGTVTTESLTTAAAATYTLTLTNARISATSHVFANLYLGTSTTGTPGITTVTPGSGSVVIVVKNTHASAALNGTLKISFFVAP